MVQIMPDPKEVTKGVLVQGMVTNVGFTDKGKPCVSIAAGGIMCHAILPHPDKMKDFEEGTIAKLMIKPFNAVMWANAVK